MIGRCRMRLLDSLSDNQKSKPCAGSSRSIQNRKLVGIIALLVVFAMCGAVAQAQQAGRLSRIGFLAGTGDPSNPPPAVEAFRQGLRDLGFVEGKNILVEYRYAEGRRDHVPSLVKELVQLKVDVLVLLTLPSVRAAKETTKTIPIVMVLAVDPVAAGLVDSLARPGGNITGLSTLQRELSGKRLELLKEVVPAMSRVGILRDADAPGSAIGFKEYEEAARALKVQLHSLEVRGPELDLEGAFQGATKGRTQALITIRNPLLRRYTKRIAELAIQNRLPSLFEGSESVEASGLISYGTNDAENFKRAVYYVDRILRGSKPADLPIEQPTKFELVINLKTAKQIGLTIPQSVLYRADKVIK
jgi:putative tryptophan/tyrosine transport system substrate-binding protein